MQDKMIRNFLIWHWENTLFGTTLPLKTHSSKSWTKYRRQWKILKSKQHKENLRSYNPKGRNTQDMSSTSAGDFPFRAFSSSQCRKSEAKQKVSVLLIQDSQTNWTHRTRFQMRRYLWELNIKKSMYKFPLICHWLTLKLCTHREGLLPPKIHQNLLKMVVKC